MAFNLPARARQAGHLDFSCYLDFDILGFSVQDASRGHQKTQVFVDSLEPHMLKLNDHSSLVLRLK
jgi:hypothetical protein